MNSYRTFHLLALALAFVIGSSYVFAQYPNIRVSSVSSNSPNEVCITINPTNPQNLAGGANLNFYYYSTNGGLSWTQGVLSSSFGVAGDPVLLFDGQGNLYYAHLSNPSGGSWLDRIVVQKSTNGGVSWNNGVGVGLNPPKDQDKQWLAYDMTNSPYRNNLYMSWTEFDTYGSSNPLDSTRILFSRSTNFGDSWSTPIRISDRGGDCVDEDNTVEGAVPAVGPNGEVYLAWSGPLGIVFDKSTDGGVTFGSDVFVTSQPGGWDFDVSGIYRCNGLPITACDVSNSTYRGTIYVLWSDQRNGINNTDVFLSKSTDGGSTWNSVRRVNNDVGTTHQFFPWLTIDQTTGYLYTAFYDRRNTTGNATDVFLARSTDGGETFENFRVSTSSFTPSSGVFFGDYMGIAAHARNVYPIWMRMDGTAMSVWMSIIRDTTTTSVIDQGNQAGDFFLSQNYPNPFNPTTDFHFSNPKLQLVSVKVYDVLGRNVATLLEQEMKPGKYSVMLDGTHLPSGVYYCRLEAGDRVEARKIVLMK